MDFLENKHHKHVLHIVLLCWAKVLLVTVLLVSRKCTFCHMLSYLWNVCHITLFVEMQKKISVTHCLVLGTAEENFCHTLPCLCTAEENFCYTLPCLCTAEENFCYTLPCLCTAEENFCYTLPCLCTAEDNFRHTLPCLCTAEDNFCHLLPCLCTAGSSVCHSLLLFLAVRQRLSSRSSVSVVGRKILPQGTINCLLPSCGDESNTKQLRLQFWFMPSSSQKHLPVSFNATHLLFFVRNICFFH